MKLTEQDYKELATDLSNAMSLAFDYGVKFAMHILEDSTIVAEVKDAKEARCRMFDRICRKLVATVYRDEPIPYKREEVRDVLQPVLDDMWSGRHDGDPSSYADKIDDALTELENHGRA